MRKWKEAIEKAQNMKEGNPYKLLFVFMVPLFIGNIFQQLYNVVDSIVVGHYLDASALSAVGSAFSVIFLLLSVFIGFGLAAMIMVAQLAGKKDEAGLARLLQTIYSFVFVISIPLALAGVIFARPLLLLLQLTDQPAVLEQAVLYLRIIFVGLVAQLGFNVNAGFLQGLGDSLSSLWFLILACILNILLDVAFVLGLGMGVEGVAYATVLAQLLAWTLGVLYLKRKYPFLKLRLTKFVFDFSLLKEIVHLGFPISLQQLCYSLSNLVLIAFVNQNGTLFAAGFNLSTKVETFAFLPLMSMATAITTFTGQNMLSSPQRQREGRKASMISMLCMAIFWATLVYLGRVSFLKLFTSQDAIIEQGAKMLQAVMPFYVFLGIMSAYNAIFQGTGNTFVPMWNTILTQLFARTLFVFVLFYAVSKTAIYYSYATSWILGSIFCLYFYYSGRWKNYIRLVEIEKLEKSETEEA